MGLPLTILRPAAADLPLDRGEVLRYLGYRPGVTQMGDRIDSLVNQGIDLTLEVASPVVSLGSCGIIVAGDEVLTRVPGLAWRSRALARLLKDAGGVSLVAATLGPGVDELIAQLFATEEYALATIVDAVGSALVQGLGRHARACLEEESGGLCLSPLFGPGYGDWDLHDQIQLTEEAGGPLIGLTCTETCFLMPQKSLVGIIGLMEPGRAAAIAGGCALCRMKECPYRIGVERP